MKYINTNTVGLSACFLTSAALAVAGESELSKDAGLAGLALFGGLIGKDVVIRRRLDSSFTRERKNTPL